MWTIKLENFPKQIWVLLIWFYDSEWTNVSASSFCDLCTLQRKTCQSSNNSESKNQIAVENLTLAFWSLMNNNIRIIYGSQKYLLLTD